MIHLTDKISLDPGRAAFDLSLEEAFRLTEVRSVEDYRNLRLRLPYLKGRFYFFINVLDRPTLVITVIVAEGDTVTATFPLDADAMGITSQDLAKATESEAKDGNYPLTPDVKEKVASALDRSELFLKYL